MYSKRRSSNANIWKIRRIKTYKRGYPILQNVDTRNSKWNIGEIKEFRVKGFSNYKKNGKSINTIKLEIDEENIIFVNAGKWHIENIWTFETIFCEIIGLTFNGLPKLIVKDSRHPKYEVGKIYNFKVKNCSGEKNCQSCDVDLRPDQLKDRNFILSVDAAGVPFISNNGHPLACRQQPAAQKPVVAPVEHTETYNCRNRQSGRGLFGRCG
jgi:hypothetical protein